MQNFIFEDGSRLNVRREADGFDVRIIGEENVTITKTSEERMKQLYLFLKKQFEEAEI